jgi:hypothetical protein
MDEDLVGMAREVTTTDIVWLAVLRGASLEETWQEAQREAGHSVSRDYVASLRSEANRLIRLRSDELDQRSSN